jgi:hypothetical protein
MMTASATAQGSRGAKPNKGPRALGLIEITNGKAQLIPIVILIDGQYFDASAYKASPVPMALWGDTVYEGVHTGVSQGLFTVKSAFENHEKHEWLGEGTWLPASAIHAKSARKDTSSIPRGLNEDEGPPVLRHAGKTKPKAPDAAPAAPAPATPTSTPPPPATAAAPPTPPPVDEAKPAAPAAPPEPDKEVPTLKRGKPAPKPAEPPEPMSVPTSSEARRGNAAKPAPPASPAQVFPAISAEAGPEPSSYSYSMKPEEEQQFRKKMLAMAGDEVRARAKLLSAQTIQSPAEPAKSPTTRRSAAAKPPEPDFEDVQLRVFDLNSTNEPVLVLSAKAHFPQSSKAKDASSGELQYLVTLVARQDVNADFHKVFSNVTDTSHLDVIPRMELIDAVDVDGDGRGELLFRQLSDAGTAFVVYRVIGNELYALFQGTPGE